MKAYTLVFEHDDGDQDVISDAYLAEDLEGSWLQRADVEEYVDKLIDKIEKLEKFRRVAWVALGRD
jgi:hypothetical protein